MKISVCYAIAFLSAANVAHGEGFVYVQTNEPENHIIVYEKNDDGSLTERERVATGGKGVGEVRPLHNGEPGPDPLASSNSLILDHEQNLLFASNAGDNSVSVLRIGDNGTPTLLDHEASGGDVVNSLAYHSPSNTLYVAHMRGPEHIRAMSFAGDDLVLRDGGQSLETDTLKGRIQSQIVLSPDGDFLLGNVLADQKPDGSGIHGSTESNLAVIPVNDDGSLAEPEFQTLQGEEPFSSIFLNSDENYFLTIFAESNNVALQQLNDDGSVQHISSAKGDDKSVGGKPLEYCWVALSPDQDYAYLSAFGTGDVASFKIDGTNVSLAQSGIAKVEASTDFMAAAKVPSSAPVDSWASDDGYFYQIYGAEGKLGAFRMTEEGGLEEIALYDVPVNSVQGIAGR